MTTNLASLRAIFFDLDDTLLDHRGAVRAALGDVYEAFPWFFRSLDFAHVQSAWHQINDAIWEEYSRGLLSSDTLKLQRSQRLVEWVSAMLGDTGGMDAAVLRDLYMERYEARCAVFDGVLPMLDALRARFTLGIITNGFGGVQSRKLVGTGLAGRFDHVIVSEVIGAHKPDPAIFQAALTAAGRAAAEAVYIGDNYMWDIRGARHAGMAAVWYNPTGAHSPAEYSDVEPDAVVRSIQEIPALFGVSQASSSAA